MSGRLPDVRWRDQPEKPDWRDVHLDDDPDDEELEQTPSDVTTILGFDPLESDEKKDEPEAFASDDWSRWFAQDAEEDWKEEAHPRDEDGKFAKTAEGATAAIEFHRKHELTHRESKNGHVARPHARAIKHYQLAREHYEAGRQQEGEESHAEAEKHGLEAIKRQRRAAQKGGQPPPAPPPEPKAEEKPPGQALAERGQVTHEEIKSASSKKRLAELVWHQSGAWNHATPRMARIIKNAKNLDDVTNDESRSSFYSSGRHLINMADKHGGRGTTRGDYVWRHEFGHAIDATGIGGMDHSEAAWDDMLAEGAAVLKSARESRFTREEYQLDRVEELAETIEKDHGITHDELREFNRMISQRLTTAEVLSGTSDAGLQRPNSLAHDMNAGVYLDDFFGAATLNKIGRGHSNDYYERNPTYRTCEMFANYVCLTEGPHGKIYRAILHSKFPKTCTHFERILDNKATDR